MENQLYLIKYDEIGLKGNNRHLFENKLIKNIKNILKENEFTGHVHKTRGRIYLETNSDIDNYLRKTAGIASYARAFSIKKEPDFFTNNVAIFDKLLEINNINFDSFRFKIESRRHDKKFHQTSPEISCDIGEKILNRYPGAKVDVHTPELTIYIEVRDNIYIYGNSIQCHGGLPVGTTGRTLILLSGGIDSPVAAIKMALRGISLTGLHFHSYPYTSAEAQQKVIDLAKIIKQYSPRFRLNFIDFAKLQKSIRKNVQPRFFTVIMRRVMLMIAEKLANELHIPSITTGESLGQVSSQTMESLNCTNSSIKLPIFRPLIAFNKLNIITEAKDYDTFELSIKPFEDCCTIFNPPNPATMPDIEKVIADELRIPDLMEEIDECVKKVEMVDLS